MNATPTRPQVLVVDDEASIVDAVATALRSHRPRKIPPTSSCST
jgi:CheY-like chemotaxis protein